MMKRRTFLKTSAAAASLMAMPSIIGKANASEAIKIGCLFSSSGTMANVEGRLNEVVKMAVDEINGKGGVLGKQVEALISDPASDWPLYAQLSRQMLQQEKVASLFGCWTSVSRKSVLPVVEQNNGLLYYPLHFEGEENSKNVVYLNSPPASSVLPAIDYLMSEDGGNAKRFYMLGSDYVWPRTINKICKGYFESKGITADSWREEYVPFGFSNFQTLVNDIRKFASEPGGQPVIILTTVGSSIPAFFKEIINQGITATDIPVLGLDVLEADLEGLDTQPMVGHLNCWAYLQNAQSDKNDEFKDRWKQHVNSNGLPYKNNVVIDPMVSAYDGVHLWARACDKAGTTDVDAVRAASNGLTFECPSGYDISMGSENTYVSRGVFIGSVNADQGFDVLWQSEGTPKPVPFSPYV
ncbi:MULTISPECIES: urea ABC transporter substrate-binding protein [unclassified Thalassospira]|uniref:urea ABC transporter substrate-binding protein n=1 Tax=unclassified Thalassospira TaxID=2648997 RepID=UPI000ED3E2B4|nr:MULTISPECIES: urea ABC transporter substrate-binding protein [unclassified Thalassospira]HAI31383.1 branched-chain amino acid ABC transporter substrate-binding protein [Thalassospira sp.]